MATIAPRSSGSRRRTAGPPTVTSSAAWWSCATSASPRYHRRRAPRGWPPALSDPFPGAIGVPEIAAADVTSAILGGALLHHGSLLVRGLVPADRAAILRQAIDHAFAAYDASRARHRHRGGCALVHRLRAAVRLDVQRRGAAMDARLRRRAPGRLAARAVRADRDLVGGRPRRAARRLPRRVAGAVVQEVHAAPHARRRADRVASGRGVPGRRHAHRQRLAGVLALRRGRAEPRRRPAPPVGDRPHRHRRRAVGLVRRSLGGVTHRAAPRRGPSSPPAMRCCSTR